MTASEPSSAARPTARREHVLAWASDAVASLYFVWMFGLHWRNIRTFEQMYEGLGAELPWATRFVIQQGGWLFPGVCAVFVVAVIGKELILTDKRFSVMLTFFLTLVAQFVAHFAVVAYYLPLFELIHKLSG